jgi:hypothetical protein
MALSSLESEHRKLFQSEIELITPQLLTFDNLSDVLLRLAPLLGHIVCADQTSHQPILLRAEQGANQNSGLPLHRMALYAKPNKQIGLIFFGFPPSCLFASNSHS